MAKPTERARLRGVNNTIVVGSFTTTATTTTISTGQTLIYHATFCGTTGASQFYTTSLASGYATSGAIVMTTTGTTVSGTYAIYGKGY